MRSTGTGRNRRRTGDRRRVAVSIMLGLLAAILLWVVLLSITLLMNKSWE